MSKPPIWSFTFLNTYANICAYQAYRRFIVKNIPFVETDAIKRGNDVHSAMELRVGTGKPLPIGMKAYEPFAAGLGGRGAMAEIKLGMTKLGQGCDFFHDSVWGRGKLDITVIDKDKAYIADWKTGSIREEPFELEVQALLLNVNYPNLKKIWGQYHWLKEPISGKLYDLSDTESYADKIHTLMEQVERDHQAERFEKRRGPLCKWCQVRDCEFNKNPDFR